MSLPLIWNVRTFKRPFLSNLWNIIVCSSHFHCHICLLFLRIYPSIRYLVFLFAKYYCMLFPSFYFYCSSKLQTVNCPALVSFTATVKQCFKCTSQLYLVQPLTRKFIFIYLSSFLSYCLPSKELRVVYKVPLLVLSSEPPCEVCEAEIQCLTKVTQEASWLKKDLYLDLPGLRPTAKNTMYTILSLYRSH